MVAPEEATVTPLEQRELLDMIAEKVRSGDWWVILGVKPSVQIISSRIESTYYMQDNNEDFEVAFVPLLGGIVLTLLAKKKWMTQEQLVAILDEVEGRNPVWDYDVAERTLETVPIIWIGGGFVGGVAVFNEFAKSSKAFKEMWEDAIRKAEEAEETEGA